MPTVILKSLALIGSAASTSVGVLPHVQVKTLTLAASAETNYPQFSILTPAEVNLLRGETHETKVWANVLSPVVLWSARINDASAGRSTTAVVFDGGSGSGFSQVEGDMMLWIGTSAGARDIAEIRLKGDPTTSDAGVTGTANVQHHSWVLADNQYLSFMFDFPVIQKFPLIDVADNDIFKKDRDIAYTDENTKPTPVCICGTDRAGFLTGADITFTVSAADSYTIADGATITSYALDVRPDIWNTKVFNTTTGGGTVTFTQPGQWWLEFTCTDSNGKSQKSRRAYWVNDPDPAGTARPVFEFTGLRLTGSWDRGGWSSAFSVHNDAALADIPDKARVLIWGENTYGTTKQSITLFPFGDVETILGGYLIRDTTNEDLKTGAGEVNFEVHTPEEFLKKFNFSVDISAVEGTPTKWYEYEKWLTVGRAVHHLWKHHSSIFGTCDIIGLNTNTFPRYSVQFEEGNLYSMADSIAHNQGIRAHLVSDMGGRIHLSYDLQLLIDSTRSGYQTVFDMTVDDISGQIELRREPVNQAAFVKVSGFHWDGTTFITNEGGDRVPDNKPVCASAPGLTPAHSGSGIFIMDRQTVFSQTHINELAGRVYAQQNNEYRSIPLSFHGNYHGVFDVAYEHWYKLSLQANDTARGVVWTDQKLACRSVTVQFDTKAGTSSVNGTFEAEMDAIIGEAGFCLETIPEYGGEEPLPGDDSDPEDPGDPEDPEDPGDSGIPDALITSGPGSSIYFKGGVINSWVNRSTLTDIADMIQDPFWPTTQGSVSSDKAILFKCGPGFIRRSINGSRDWSSVTPSSNPPNDAGDSPAPSIHDIDFVQMDGSWSISGEFVAVGTWQNFDGDWRTWLVYTSDNGANWAWEFVVGRDAAGPFTFQEAKGFYDTGTGPLLSSNSGPLGWRSVNYQARGHCVLSQTKAIHIATQFFSDPPYTDIVAFIITMDSNGVITSTTGPTTILAATDSSQNGYSAIARISDTKFVVGYVDFEFLPDPPFTVWVPLRAKICDLVGGTSITVGTAIDIVGIGENVPIGEFDVVTLDSTTVAFPMVYGSSFGDDEMAVKILYSISGRSGSVGSVQKLDDGNNYFNIKGTAMDSTRFLVHMSQGDSGKGHGVVVGVRHTGSGACSFGTPGFFDELDLPDEASTQIRGGFGIKLTDTKWVVIYERDRPGPNFHIKRVGIFTPSTLAVSVTGNLHVSEDDQSVARLSDSRFIVVAEDPDFPGDNIDVRVRRYSVSGSTITTHGGWFTYSYPSFTKAMHLFHPEHLSPIPSTDMFLCSSTIVDQEEDWGAFGVTDGDGLCRAFTLKSEPDLPANTIRGFGVSIGKGAGDRVYLTAWDETFGGNFRLFDYDLPALTKFAEYSLGRGLSTGEVSPFAGFGDDDWIVVYGELVDPYSLGTPTKIIESTDGGVTALLVLLAANWNGGRCDALWMEPDGTIYAIRDVDLESELYVGPVADFLSFMTRLGFPGSVNPHAIKVDPFDLSVYLGAEEGQSVMVIKSFPPYFTWTDMTFDHDTTSAINSLELL